MLEEYFWVRMAVDSRSQVSSWRCSARATVSRQAPSGTLAPASPHGDKQQEGAGGTRWGSFALSLSPSAH